jgi:DNA-binding IscR family transcriptional regulator
MAESTRMPGLTGLGLGICDGESKRPSRPRRSERTSANWGLKVANLADESSGDGWLSVSALARLRGVQKSAISKRVARLEKEGLVHPRLGPLNSKEVNVAEFVSAVERTTDAIREANGRAASPVHRMAADANGRRATANPVSQADIVDTPGDPILAREQAKRAQADAELKRMDLEERRGRIVSADQCKRFVDACSANAQIVLWRLPGLVEEIIAIGTKDGVPAARTFVKSHVRAAINEVGALMRMVAERDGEPPVEAADADV